MENPSGQSARRAVRRVLSGRYSSRASIVVVEEVTKLSERREVHYLWPEGHPVEEALHERLSGPAEAVAPDGGRTGDVRDRLVVGENAQSKDNLEPRTKRAVAEAMDVSLLSKGGRYEVQSASGNRYEVDVIKESCTCPDWQQRSPEGGCKHLRRVDHEIKRGRVPRPDGRLPSP